MSRISLSGHSGRGQGGGLIQAVRSTVVGVSAEFVVRFGVSGTGAMTATLVETTGSKIAA